MQKQNGIHGKSISVSHPTALFLMESWISDAKERVIKHCNSMVIDDINAYLYYLGDKLSTTFDFHQAELVHVPGQAGMRHFELSMTLH